MTIIYAVDPGARKTKNRASYLATFDAGELVQAAPITFEAARNGLLDQPDVLVAEKPQQDGRSGTVPPGTLIKLSWYGALTIGALRPLQFVEYEPDDWKGQVDKPTHHRRIWKELTPLERKCFPDDTEERINKGALATAKAGGKLTNYSFEAHNLLDAAGLGLFHLKRLGVGGVSVTRRGPVKRVTFADISKEYRKAGGK
jgi:hypothetical protein